ADKIYAITQPLEKKPMAEWGEDEKKLAGLMSQIYQWSASYQGLPFTVVPSYLPNDERWMSPWDIFQAAFKTTEGREEAVALRDLMVAYWNGEQIPFDLAAKHFQQSVRTRYQSTMGRDLPDGKLEIAYNKANLFLWTKISYALAFLVFLFSLVSDKKYLYPLAWGLTVAGFVTQTIGLGMRIAILGRPPVSNLYETFVFVSFMIGLSGMIIERLNRQWLGLVVSAIGGFVFLLIANKFASEGDTLRMLVAVLNSNFWLSTHVLSITTGYAGACVAGIIGHIYILQAIFKPNNKALQERTSRVLLGALGFGLAMTFLGTNLGGIWADESWGRFWGWDPKENGALLIILWIAMIFHARLGGLIGPLGVAASSVLVLIVVMWAWFGVNLLSIGLHSYGFMQGVATNLAVYVTLQLLFLSITIPIALGRQHANKSSKT
ncbi:MAG: cytochrome c biogenesis protein CcsA, partial [Candidatus Omnitrophota bacterium]|nr:cytochrome c biogenesis protein CcsA [Candidatus Omnitrophota bacterium]